MKTVTATLRSAAAKLRRWLAVPTVPSGGRGLIVYPLDVNPYQGLLYEAVQTADARYVVLYVRRHPGLGPVPFFVRVTLARVRGFRLLHLHWPQFALHWDGRHLLRLSLVNARVSLWWVRLLGIRLVWTVHNAIPHEPETADDAAISRTLARVAARKIVHSAETTEQLAGLGADTDRVAIIPHGSYVASYSEAPRAQSRRELGLPETARIVMFFGQIRPYKGVDDLVDAWEAVAAQEPGAPAPFLLVVGRCDDEMSRDRLKRDTGRLGGRFDDGYVPHELLPLYFAAADVVALPFRKLTTSGSAVLALSLGRPVLASRVGGLRDLPGEVGFFYEAGGLTDALTRALTAPSSELDERAEAARRYAGRLSWDRIAAATLDVYEQAAAPDRVSR